MKRLISLLFIFFSMSGLAAESETVDAEVNRYTSLTAWGVNSYWIETKKNIILIDAQLLPADAKNLASIIKNQGKPLAAVFITHPHPDHFAGLAVLRDEFDEFPIYSSKTTAENLKSAFNRFLKSSFSQPFGEKVEKRFIAVNNVLKNKALVNIDGLKIQLDDIGAGESENNSLIYFPQKNWLFSGDATMHHVHYYVGEGRSKNILSQLKYIKKQYSESTLYTGHGEPAKGNIVNQQIDYVEFLRKLVFEAIQDTSNLNDERTHLEKNKRHEIALQVFDKFPYLGNFGIETSQVIKMNLWGVEAELLSEQKKQNFTVDK